MNKTLAVFGVIVVSVLGILGQNINLAKVDWQLYTDASEDFAVAFPKLPVKDDTSDLCKNQSSMSYVTYSEEVIYKVKVARKNREKPPNWCTEQDSFDETLFVRSARKAGSLVEKAKNGLDFFHYKEGSTRYWVFDDPTRNRLIELSITDRDGSKTDYERFVNSFHISAIPDAKEIGNGATATLGDPPVVSKSSETEPEPTSNANASYVVVHQPRAKYTKEARKQGIQGGVLLKILLLPNGSVGNITVVTAQPFGLTEQAIWAARRIVFLPKVKDGKRMAIIVSREYAFSIY